MNWITEHALGPLLPLVVAPLAMLLGKMVLNVNTKMDGLEPWMKQAVVIAIAAGLTAAGGALGADVCKGEPCAGDFSNLDIKALVSAVLAFALHAGAQPKNGRKK